jgi:hypothetical protein
MKNLVFKSIAIFIISLSLYSNAKAQSVTFKTAAFENYANEIVCDVNALNQLFTKSTGETVQLNLGANLSIIGTVKSAIQKQTNLKTMVVALSNFPNVVFSISKLSDIYTPEKYVGRLMGSTYNDLFELVLTDGVYTLKKHQYNNVIMPCHQ